MTKFGMVMQWGKSMFLEGQPTMNANARSVCGLSWVSVVLFILFVSWGC